MNLRAAFAVFLASYLVVSCTAADQLRRRDSIADSFLHATDWDPTPAESTRSDPTNEFRTTNELAGDFCWRVAYGRGVGTIPETCPGDRDQRGLFCYSKCPEGFANPSGTVDCHQMCPEGWRDDGLFCRLAEFGRGAGYPWQYGDPLVGASGMFARCEADHGVGNCERYLAVVYPKCLKGYSPWGCCICRPDVPDCEALGFNKVFLLISHVPKRSFSEILRFRDV
jgi:hypothetical protein